MLGGLAQPGPSQPRARVEALPAVRARPRCPTDTAQEERQQSKDKGGREGKDSEPTKTDTEKVF